MSLLQTYFPIVGAVLAAVSVGSLRLKALPQLDLQEAHKKNSVTDNG
jgi:hypothetical protein